MHYSNQVGDRDVMRVEILQARQNRLCATGFASA